MSYFPEGWSPAQCIMVVEGREREPVGKYMMGKSWLRRGVEVVTTYGTRKGGINACTGHACNTIVSRSVTE